jgi:hypothetical protein
MVFNSKEQFTLETVKRLVNIRRENMALNYGDFNVLVADKGYLCIRKNLPE